MPKYIISGGGTGGHIFPAIAIADALKEEDSSAEILFVGANGRMEMERVPKAGYEIIGLDIMGIQRRLTLKNLKVPFMLIKSLIKARKVIKDFAPDVAIGVGGYASGPLLRVASALGVPTLIQEQNSYPGITNKLLAKKAASICVAYEDMQRFFPFDKIRLTGNPVRAQVVQIADKRNQGLDYFKLAPNKKTILIIGGSLGARSINDAIIALHAEIVDELDYQIIWQTGKRYFEQVKESVKTEGSCQVKVTKFIDRMDLAYAAADLIISRAGALSISELCLIAKPTILIPSPNVSEDHQTKNAMALVQRDAAILIKDDMIEAELLSALRELKEDKNRSAVLSSNIRSLGKVDASREIVAEISRIRQ